MPLIDTGLLAQPAIGTSLFSIQGLSIYQGTFTAPPDTLFIGGTFIGDTPIFLHTGGTFLHNSATVEFDPYRNSCSATYYTIDVDINTAFYNVIFNGSQSCGVAARHLIPPVDTFLISNDVLFSNGMVTSGFMDVKNDARVVAGFDGGNGTLIFSGANTQNFDLTGAIANFDGEIKLIKPTAAAQVELQSNLEMDANGQNFDFIKGQLLSTSTNRLIVKDGVTVSNASDSSFVDGIVRKIGNDAFTFPIGKGTSYGGVGISIPASLVDTFDAEYFDATPHPTYDRRLRDASLSHVSDCEYWILDRTVGSSDVSVTLSWKGNRSCGVANLSHLAVARWDGASWKDHGNSGTTGGTAAGTVISASAITSFSPFTLASTSRRNPLMYCDCCNKSKSQYGSISKK